MMSRVFWKLVAVVLVSVTLVQVYVGVVQILSAFRPDGMLKPIELKGSRKLGGDGTFLMGEKLRIIEESILATAYAVRICKNESSVVYEGQGRFRDSLAEEDVQLGSSTFSPGSYVVTLSAFSCNVPIPGVQFSDTQSTTFQVTGAETRLAVNASFDSCLGSLEVCANLTGSDGYPVADEAIEFSNRLANRTKLTDGWMPIGSATTGSDGIAVLRVAFGMPSGNYSVMVRHDGNSNFGESEAVTNVEAIMNWTIDDPNEGMQGLSPLSVGLTTDDGVMNWTLDFDNEMPYARLQTNLTARCTSDFNLTGECCQMLFFLDHMDWSWLFGGVLAECSSAGLLVEYGARCIWTPMAVGLHKVIVGIYNGSTSDLLYRNASFAKDIVSSAEVTLDIQPCPASLILQCASAVRDDSVPIVPVTAGFFAPKRYAAGSTPYCSSTIMAPLLEYDEHDYTFDDPIESVDMQLYVNGSFRSRWWTEKNGLLTFPLRCDFAGSYSTFNLTVVANASSLLYESKAVNGMVNFTRVSIHDAATSSSDFEFNYTIYNCNQKTDVMYVGEEPNAIKATADLFSLPVENAVVNFSAAKRTSYATVTRASHTTAVPTEADFLRVVNVTVNNGPKPYERIRVHLGNGQNLSLDGQNCLTIPKDAGSVTLLLNPPTGDIYKDGCVDIYDAVRLAGAFGYSTGQTKYNADADLNNDGVIDIYDAVIFGRNFSVTNDTAYVDGAAIEFFDQQFEAQAQTDNSGASLGSWCLSDAGTYLVRATLPSDLNVTVNFHSEVTRVNACLRTIGYVTVVKRPVQLTLVSPDQSCTQVASADADAYISENDDKNYGNEEVLKVGVEPGGGGQVLWTLIRFDISDVPANAYVVSARLNLFGSCDMYEGQVGICRVYRVGDPWYEDNVRWGNQPGYGDPSSSVLFSPGWTNRWLFFDVTEDVRLWQNGSNSNYGFLLMGTDLSMTLNSREASSNNPALEVSYITASPDLVASAYDNVADKPVPSLHVTFNIDSWTSFERDTNLSGLACIADWYANFQGAHLVSVSSVESATYEAGFTRSSFDLRFPTSITAEFQNPANATVGLAYTYNFSLASSSLFALEDMPVWLSVAGTFANGTCHTEAPLESTTVSDGTVSFSWAAPADGTYFFNATFYGSDHNTFAQAFATVNASVTPLAVLFDVSPHEFIAGTSLLLNATIIDISTNRTMSGPYITVEFLRTCSNGSTTPLDNVGNSSGMVTFTTDYPSDDGKAYAYMAKIVPAAGTLYQGIACNPLQLTVSRSTSLLLNVTRDWASGNHIVEGWLLSITSGIDGKRVKITVNGTEYLSSITNASGYFRLSLNLKPVNNNATTYTITASFEDTAQPVTATAWAKTLDGQQYPACTTIQYGYKPAYNTTTLTVLPQSTEALTMTTSPEEVQKQAQDSGWMPPPKPEFSWWYPWFRLHFIGQYKGIKMIDVGITLWGDDSGSLPYKLFRSKMNEWNQKVSMDLLVGILATEAVVWVGSHFGPVYFLLAFSMYLGYKIYRLLTLDWNSVESLQVSLESSFVSLVISAWSGLCTFLPETWRAIAAGTASIKSWVFAFLCKVIMIPINIYLMIKTWDRLVALGGV